jgi:hypothetical protein
MADWIAGVVFDVAASINLLTAVPLSLAGAFLSAWRQPRCRFVPSIGWLLVSTVGWLLFFSLFQPFARQVRFYDNERAQRLEDYGKSCVNHKPGTSPLHPACIKTQLDTQESSYSLAWADVTASALEWIDAQLNSLRTMIIVVLVLVVFLLSLVIYVFLRFQDRRAVISLQRNKHLLTKLGVIPTHGPTADDNM